MSSLFEDSENDLPLPGRRASAEDGTRHTREMANTEPEREVTLNTGIVLALFFALALLCAVFFGFGYSMGRKSVPPAPVAETDTSSSTNEVANNAPKPSPGSLATVPVPSYVGPTGSASSDAKPATVKTTTVAADTLPASTEAATHTPPTADASLGTPSTTPVARVAPAPSATSLSSSAAAPSAIYVQVSAVSHQEDANVLLSALRRRGYTVFTRSDPNDSLIHVQLGPFPTKKDADTMRQRLSGDGYNAILK